MKLSARALEVFNSLHLGILSFKCVIKDSDINLNSLIERETEKILNEWQTDTITTRKHIASTRKAYKLCGKDPSRYRPSADSLMRRILKGNNLYMVNNVVDILNLVSLQTGFSIGGYDADKIDGSVVFDIGNKDEVYNGIGRGKLNIENLPVLRDNIGSFGSPTSDSERTMIQETAMNILFVFFDFSVSENLGNWLETTKELLMEYCGAIDFYSEIVTLEK